MKKSLITLITIAVLFLAGCQGSPTAGGQSTQAVQNAVPASATQPATGNTAYPPPTAAAAPTVSYPAPGSSSNATAESTPAAQAAYPAPTEQNGIGSSYPAQQGDSAMTEGKFFIDSASLQPDTAHPEWTDLSVEGSLPTPCNFPRVTVNPPDNQNRIVVNAYSVADPNKMCTEVIKPFSGRIAILGGYPTGKYTVMVNDKTAGELNVP